MVAKNRRQKMEDRTETKIETVRYGSSGEGIASEYPLAAVTN
jgi:hypothetical protein